MGIWIHKYKEVEDQFYLKTDSAGNLIWLKYLGNVNQHDGTAALAITPEGNYIAAFHLAIFYFLKN